MCSISYTLMVNPVLGTCCNKRYYEKVVFEAVIEQTGRCPFCRKRITRDDMAEILPLKASINSFRKRIAKKARKLEQQRIEQDGLE